MEIEKALKRSTKLEGRVDFSKDTRNPDRIRITIEGHFQVGKEMV